jgi:thioredoxin-related protein
MGGARQLLLTATIVLVCTSGLRAQSRTENAWPGSSTPPTAVGQSRIEWVESWAEAQALAARHHRLILVHFWSPDCAPCWKLERSVFNQPECIRAVSANYVPWKVNVVDISPQGCRVELPVRVKVDDTIWVTFPGLEAIQGKVCWVDEWIAGIEFKNPLHAAVFDMVEQRMRRGE